MWRWTETIPGSSRLSWKQPTRRRRRGGCIYIVIGFASRHPWLPWLRKRFRPREYASMLYTVHWEKGGEVLDGRIPHVEVALL